MKKIIALIIAFCIAFGAIPMCFAEEGEKPEMTEYGFVDCGDVKIEYGVYGKADGEALCFCLPTAEICTALTIRFSPKCPSISRL